MEAGVRLLEKRFFAEPADNDHPEPRTFHWMSREQVITNVANGPLPHLGTLGRFNDRWSTVSDYLGDLILYALRDCRWAARTNLAEQAADAIRDGDPLADAVHEVTYRVLRDLTGKSSMRFLFLFTALVDRDPVIGDAIRRVYSNITKAWGAVYAEAFRIYDLKLRPGLSMDSFTVMLSAAAEGLALRSIGDRETPVRDVGRRVSLLGTAVLAFLVACVDPGDGRTLEEAANGLADPESDADRTT
ncbi:MAG: hypothetical protein ACRDTF_08800 [Pseudonocardiaceae bacterium]